MDELLKAYDNVRDDEPMPEPTVAGALMNWKGKLYVAIVDPGEPCPRQRRRGAHPPSDGSLIWTPAPKISPSGKASLNS